MIITVTLNPAIDQTFYVPWFKTNQVNRVESKLKDVGGKGINVSKTLKVLQTDTIALGVLGGENGRWIERALNQLKIPQHFFFRKEETRMNMKIVDEQAGLYTDINEKGEPLGESTLAEVEKGLLELISEGDIVVIAGKLPPMTNVNIYKHWVEKAKAKGAKVFLDGDGPEFASGILAEPTLIKPNREELERLYHQKLGTIKELVWAGKQLIERGIETVVVSLADQGALFLTQGETLLAQAIKVKVQSTVGAGDGMMAALAYGAEKKLSLNETARLAIATSTATIIEAGTQVAKKEKIDQFLPLVKIEEVVC